jgi:hypothetical protein
MAAIPAFVLKVWPLKISDQLPGFLASELKRRRRDGRKKAQ